MNGATSGAVSITFNNAGADPSVVRASQIARPVGITFNNAGADPSVVRASQIARPVGIAFNNAGSDPAVVHASAVSRPLSVTFNNSGPDPAHPLAGAARWLSVGFCSCAFDPAAATFAREGGSGQVGVTTDVVNCQWGAQSPVPWVSVTAGGTMTGAGPVQFTVARNTTFQSRQATLSVGGAAYTVTQGGWPFAAVPAFTDDPLTARSTVVKTAHLTELRKAVDDLRERFGLTPIAWTDAAPGAGTTPVTAVHLAELRAAMNAVYESADRQLPTYTDLVVVAGQTVIKAAHVTELRLAVAAIW
ncbi:MAG TPA: BACON domain-containing protein [Propionicimonas sp.]